MYQRFVDEDFNDLWRTDGFEEFIDAAIDEALSVTETEALTSNTPTPGRFYVIQSGKGGLEATAGRAYGLKEGPERRQRAQEINDHPLNRKFWRSPQNAYERRYYPDGIISFNSVFTCGEEQRRAKKGERRCVARIWIPREDVPNPARPDEIIFLYDDKVDWSNISTTNLHFLLMQLCSQTAPVVLPGDDNRMPVNSSAILPYRWICKLIAVFLPSPGNPDTKFSQATGFLISQGRLVTSAHVLYKISDIGLERIPDFLFVIPGLTNPPQFYNDVEPMINGAFFVKRKNSDGTSNFFVPSEWISSRFDPDTDDERRDIQFDYGVVNIVNKKPLVEGVPEDSWTSVSRCLASVSALGKEEPEEVAREILSTGGKGLCTAGYPSDNLCRQMETCSFEFAALAFPTDCDHNLLIHRADVFRGMSGSPVWVEKPCVDRRIVGGRAISVRKTQRLVIGIAEGGTLVRDPRCRAFTHAGDCPWPPIAALVTYSTVITPKVLDRIKHLPFLSAL